MFRNNNCSSKICMIFFLATCFIINFGIREIIEIAPEPIHNYLENFEDKIPDEILDTISNTIFDLLEESQTKYLVKQISNILYFSTGIVIPETNIFLLEKILCLINFKIPKRLRKYDSSEDKDSLFKDKPVDIVINESLKTFFTIIYRIKPIFCFFIPKDNLIKIVTKDFFSEIQEYNKNRNIFLKKTIKFGLKAIENSKTCSNYTKNLFSKNYLNCDVLYKLCIKKFYQNQPQNIINIAVNNNLYILYIFAINIFAMNTYVDFPKNGADNHHLLSKNINNNKYNTLNKNINNDKELVKLEINNDKNEELQNYSIDGNIPYYNSYITENIYEKNMKEQNNNSNNENFEREIANK